MRTLYYLFSLVQSILYGTRASEATVQNASDEQLGSLLVPSQIVLEGAQLSFLLPYKNLLVRSLIREAKFFHNTKAITMLAQVFSDYLLEFATSLSEYSHQKIVVAPVPLSRARLRARDYNQVSEIIRTALKMQNIPAVLDEGLLMRTRDTLPQSSLKRAERLKNMRGAFTLSRLPDPQTIYLVIDDVATTGATLLDAHRAFASAEVHDVQLIAISH